MRSDTQKEQKPAAVGLLNRILNRVFFGPYAKIHRTLLFIGV